jgi:hypothetical protein
MGCNMFQKTHFLESRFDFFAKNLGVPSVISFHHEKLYHGKWSPSMLADYCQALKSDASQVKYSRKSTTITFYIITDAMF